MSKPTFANRLRAILKMRCPNCLAGAIYRPDGAMQERCPNCNLIFEREPGYFLGSLYISYAAASLMMGLIAFALYLLLPEWNLVILILIAAVLFLPLAPTVTRYARVLWIHFDRWAWPDEPSQGM